MLSRLRMSRHWGTFIPDDALLGFVAGSMLTGLTDGISDYDVIMLLPEPRMSPKPYLMYSGRKVHFTYIDSKGFLCGHSTGMLEAFGMCQMAEMSGNDTTFLGAGGPEHAFILEHVHDLLAAGLGYAMESIGPERLLEGGLEGELARTKFVYHMCYAKARWAGEPLDAEYLTLLKRIRWKPIPKWVEDRAKSDLGFLVENREHIADDAAESLNRMSDDYARRFDGK